MEFVDGKQFRKMRECMELGQWQIAKWFGVSEQTIRRWEQGKCAVHGSAQVLITLLYREVALGQKNVVRTWLKECGVKLPKR